MTIPEIDRTLLDPDTVKDSQMLQPLFEFSGACAGCGETPYLKLMSQLFGDRAIIANATGCSSIYGGNLPTTPWATNPEGRGPTWNNSLFEDNGEFGLGLRLAVEAKHDCARRCSRSCPVSWATSWCGRSAQAPQTNDSGIAAQRQRVVSSAKSSTRHRRRWPRALAVADALVRRSVWIVGGDGWAYDIGFGGLDHVLTTGPRREHPGARHGRLLEHRRPGVQGDAARRGGEIRLRRQAGAARRIWA